MNNEHKTKLKPEFIKKLLEQIPENIKEKYDLKDIIITSSAIRIEKGNIDSIYIECQNIDDFYIFKFKFKDFHYVESKFVFSNIYVHQQRHQKTLSGLTIEFRYDKNLNLDALYLGGLMHFFDIENTSELPKIKEIDKLHLLNIYNKFLKINEKLKENEEFRVCQIMKNNEECINFYLRGIYEKPLMWDRTKKKIKEITEEYVINPLASLSNEEIESFKSDTNGGAMIKVTFDKEKIIQENITYIFL